MAINSTAVLGTGATYPFKLSSDLVVDTTSGLNKLDQCLVHLIDTTRGERFFLRHFGASAEGLVFENVDPAEVEWFVAQLTDAIEFWEPRVRVIDITVQSGAEAGLTPPESSMKVNIMYHVIQTQERRNLVYPLYREA